MPLPHNTSNLSLMLSLLDDPPRVLNMDRFNGELHGEVYQYALAHFQRLLQDSTGEDFRHNCTTYEEFMRGSNNPIKTLDELQLEQVNLIDMFIQLKHSQLLNDRLKIHYVSTQNNSWEFANAMSQLFDWHGQLTRRTRLQQRVELCAPLFGTVGALYLPKMRWMGNKQFITPAEWEYLDPRTMFFESRWDKDEEIPVFCIRTVSVGRIEDQRYKDLLKKRGLKQFQRGQKNFTGCEEILDMTSSNNYTASWLAQIGDDDVEVIRIWIKDYRTHKVDIFYPTVLNSSSGKLENITPDVERAWMEAEMEFGAIVTEGTLPLDGEHHYAHMIRHMMQREERAQQLDEMQLAFLDNHIAATKQLQKTQPPDSIDELPMFRDNWRYIKIIGDQVVADGSSDLDFPVALFHNRTNPGALIGISDVDNLLSLQDAFNRLVADEIAVSYANAYPTRVLPKTLKDVEVTKEGPFTNIYVDDPGEAAIIRNLDAPRNNTSNRELMGMLMEFMQMLSGANSTVQGDVPKTRTSGAGMMALQQQAAMRFNTTQHSLSDGWAQSAKIWMRQIKQYWNGEIMIPAISPEYRESAMINIEQIDPFAQLIIERIPQDRDVREAAGNAALQVAMLAAQFGVPPQNIMMMLANQYDGSTVSRVMSQLMNQLKEDPQAQQKMSMQENAQMMQMYQGDSKPKTSK